MTLAASMVEVFDNVAVVGALKKYRCHWCGVVTSQRPYLLDSALFYPSCCMNEECIDNWNCWIIVAPRENELSMAEVNKAKEIVIRWMDERDRK